MTARPVGLHLALAVVSLEPLEQVLFRADRIVRELGKREELPPALVTTRHSGDLADAPKNEETLFGHQSSLTQKR